MLPLFGKEKVLLSEKFGDIAGRAFNREAKDLKEVEVKIRLSLPSMLKPIPAESFLQALCLDKL
jgi:hypothetical protein